MSLVLALLVLAPPRPSGVVGVAWHDKGRVEASSQRRLREGISAELGVSQEQLIADAVGEARRRRAYEIDQRDAQNLSDLQARLDLAEARFQAGDLDQAGEDAALLLERLREAAMLPGVPRLAWQGRLLRARIRWTEGDAEGADAELRRAASIDPEARLSTRRAPPEFAAAYEKQRLDLLETRDSWQPLALPAATLRDAQIEIDGRPGNRPVPPGEHYLIVRWPGASPVGVVASAAQMPQIEPPKIEVPGDLPVDQPSAQRICDALDLDQLVLARLREERVGVQVFVCGVGFAPAWYSMDPADEEATWQTLEDSAQLRPAAGDATILRSVLLDATPWPVRPQEPELEFDRAPPDRPVDTVAKPWFKRAWVWVLVGTVVAAGVTTGAVLGTRPDSRTVVVDGGEFLQ